MDSTQLIQSKTKIGEDIYIIADILADSTPISVEQREGGILATFPEVEVLFKEDSVEQAKRQGGARSVFLPISSLDQLKISTANAVPVEKENTQMNENENQNQTVMLTYTDDRVPARPITQEKAWALLGSYAAKVREQGTVSEEQLVAQYNSLPDGDEKTGFADLLRRFAIPATGSPSTPPAPPIPQNNSPATGDVANNPEGAANAPETGGSTMIDQPNPPAENAPSSVFNNPGSQKPPKKAAKTPRQPSAASLELKAAYSRDEELASKIHNTLDQSAVEVVRDLGDALKIFDGKVGVYAPLPASDTRVKAEFPNTVAAKDRDWHPDHQNIVPDPALKGSKIPLGQSNSSFDMKLVESAPGVIQGFAIYAPKGITADMLENFHSEVRRQDLIHVLKGFDSDPRSYQLVFISRKRFTSLLRFLSVEAVEVDHKNRTIIPGGQTWEIVPRRNKNSQGLSYILKSFKSGVSARPSGLNYVPLKTFLTAPPAQSDPVALTNFIFKPLNGVLAGSTITRYERLLEEHKAKFTGEGTARVYNHFSDTVSVTSFTGDGTLISMRWPYLPPAEDGETGRSTPEKVGYTDDQYNPKFKNRLAPVRELLSDVAKSRKSTAGGAPKVNLQRAKSEAIAAMLHGTDLGDKDFDVNTLV
jgi:hypothetical protein